MSDLTPCSNLRQTFTLWRVAVSEDARRKGVGRALLTGAEAWAKQRGATQVKFTTGNPAMKVLPEQFSPRPYSPTPLLPAARLTTPCRPR